MITDIAQMNRGFARKVRRQRRGKNVAFRRPDGRLDCFSFSNERDALAFAAVHDGRLV